MSERPEDVSQFVDFFVQQESKKLRIANTVTVMPEARLHLLNYNWPGNIRELRNVISRALIIAEENAITSRDLPNEICAQNQDTNETSSMGLTLKDRMRNFELATIHGAISKANGDRKSAAASLGIGLSSLYRKLEESPDENEPEETA